MLKQLLFISFLFVVSFGVTQDWDFSITDANMTIQVSSDVVSFDGNIPPEGSLLGAFYINDLGEYTCAGFQVWTGEQLAVALWGTESGLDNGFAFGETINWFIQVNNETYSASVSIMNETVPFSSTFVPNGFGQILDLDFFSSGCSDETACNYCPVCVEFDDTLCEYPEEIEYDCEGNCVNDSDGDGVCDEFEILGCMDETAANFNPNATDDDNSCEYIVFGCTNEIASNFNVMATDDDGSCLFCSDETADNYYTGTDGTFCSDDLFNNYTLEPGADGLFDCCFYVNPGCTDDGSCFDIDGDGDLDECDDSFLYLNASGESVYYQSPFPGVPAANYNPSANVLIGVNYCHYFPACQDQNAMNYGYNCEGDDILSLAESYGFSVDFNEEPSSSPFTINFNGFELVFEDSENCCLYYGCDDETADNFHDIDGVFYQNLPEEENYFNNGNINFPVMFNLDGSYEILDSDLPGSANVVSSLSSEDIDGDGLLNSFDSDPDNDDDTFLFQYSGQGDIDSFTPCVYFGCTDGGDTENGDGLIAYNYDPSANVDDGSCEYYACDDPNSMNYVSPEAIEQNASYLYCTDIDFYDNQIYIPIPDGLDDCCQYLGCLDPLSLNFNPNATIQELVFTSSGQGNSLSFNPIPILSSSGDTLGYEDTCYPYVYGCMDPIAENYNDYDGDGNSNSLVFDSGVSIYQLTDVNINEDGEGFFGIDEMDIINEFNLAGNNTNVNTQLALDEAGNPIPNGTINSVNPCEYIYGCTDPCYIEYYDVIEYESEESFNFSTINSFLNNNGCDFEYNYGCSELLIPNIPPTFDDGSCTNFLIYGCMDPLAANYNPEASINDCLACIPSISIDFNISNPECYDDLDGSISFSIFGGVPGYTYYLFNENNEMISTNSINDEDMSIEISLEIGSYVVEVVDSENYTGSISFSIVPSSDFIIDLWESGGWLNTIDGYDEYQWTLDGELLIGSEYEGNQIYPIEQGLYSVTASFVYENGDCISNTVFYDYDLFQNSIEDYEDFVITCVPNPFFDQAIINIEKNNNNRALLFDLYDSFGKKIWKESKIIENEKSFVINDLATGIYYFRVTNLNYVRIIPIMVLK